MLNIGPTGAKVPTDISSTLLKQCSENVGLKSVADVYTKRFTQIGSWGRAVTNFLVSSPETINTNSLGNFEQLCMSGHKEIRMSSVECVVNLCESHITGFNIKGSLKSSFVNLFASKPTVIPCEKYDYMYFGGHYNSSGIDTTVIMNFVNAKAVIILCPRGINNITCYQNPLLTEAYIQFDGVQYPLQPANFLSIEFLKANMECPGWSDLFPAVPQACPVRGRNKSDDTM
jgi:hypothetical protein